MGDIKQENHYYRDVKSKLEMLYGKKNRWKFKRTDNAQTRGTSSKFIRIITVKYVTEENFPE